MATKQMKRPAIPAVVTREILLEAGYRCAACGESCSLERAHVIPWRKSLEHKAENLICLCANCHQRADTEKWGQKALFALKKKPWVGRRGLEAQDVLPPALVELKIAMEFDRFDPRMQRLLVHGIAGFLQINPDDVKVLSIVRGSIIVTLLIPADKSQQLKHAFDKKDHELFRCLSGFVTQAKAKSVTAMEGNLKVPVKPRNSLFVGLLSFDTNKVPVKLEDKLFVGKLSSDTNKVPIKLGSASKLFVGNLSFETTETELREAFGAHGGVAEINLMMDRETGRPRGFGFVTMNTAEEAQAAIQGLNGKSVDGRALTVNVAKPREERPAGGGGGRREYGGSSRNRY
jgi:hypothetical protein